MPQWNDDWNEYKDILFVVDENQKILGTFFSKTYFTFDVKEKITGSGIMWLPTRNENEYDFDIVVVPPDNIKYLFHRDLTGNIKKIYEVTEYKKYDETTIEFDSVKEYIIQEPSTQEYLSKKTKTDLLTDISTAHSLLENNLNSLLQKGGAPERFGIKGVEFNDEEFKIMENLVNDFEKFVDAFITYPTVLKLNSLSVDQVNKLFGRNDSKNNIDINIDNKIADSMKVKDGIFEFLFYKLNINYEHGNPKMITDVLNEFHNKINKEQREKSIEISNKIQIYKDFLQQIEISNEPSVKSINTIFHIKHLATLFTEMVISLKKDITASSQSNINIINDVFDIIVDNIKKISNAFQNDISISASNIKINKQLLYIIKSLETNNINFITSFEKCIKDNVSDKIITFVKINNFGHNFKTEKYEVSTWNQRFNVLLNSISDITPTLNTMIVKYNDINVSYDYDNPDSAYYDNENKYKYTKQYLFGKFTKIFPPNMKNPDIAKQMKQIVEKVKGGKPVFIMGYGASGSGKTSSLINLKQVVKDEQGNPIEIHTPGIIIDMCKQICQGDDGFKQIMLNTEELFQNDENNPETYDNCRPEDKISNCVSNTYTYNYDQDNEKFVESNNSEDYATKHSYRKPGDIPKEDFGKLLEYLIDNDRLVKATTNNPQSSRSHSFAFIKFIRESEPKNGYLIVGDFAGVENTFNCNNIVTIRDFLNIKNTKTDKTYYGGDRDFTEYVGAVIKTYINEITSVNNIRKYSTNLQKFNNHFKSDIKSNNQSIPTSTIESKIDFLKNNEKDVNAVLGKYVTELYGHGEMSIKNYFEKQEEQSIRTQLTREQKQQKRAREETKRIAKLLQEEAERKTKQEAIIAEKTLKAGTAKANKERLAEQNRIAKQEQERLAEENRIAIQEQKDKENAEYIEFAKKEINENYLLDQINVIYDKYKTTLLNTMNSPKKLNEPDRLNEAGIKTYFYDFINNTLKSTFINNDLTINMEIFSKYQIDDMYAMINTMINSIKIQTIDQLVNDVNELNTKYITYEEITRSPYSTDSWNRNWQSMINNYSNESKYKSAKFKSHINNYINKKKFSSTNIESDAIFQKFIDNFVITEDYIKERSEKMNSHLFTDEYLKTTKTDLVFNKKINENVKNIFNLENEILEKVKLILQNIVNRLKQGEQICVHRRYEGYFINQSLQEMREDIKNIFYEKQRDSIFISPDYVNLCLEKYCPTHSDCFNKGTILDGVSIKSVIFKKIFQFLSKNEYFVDVETPENTPPIKQDTLINVLKTQKFYQDILVSVFCVFNISRSANNPPSVPYIDINELKIALKKYEKSLEKYKKNKTYGVYITEFQNNLIELKTNLKKTYYKITGKILGVGGDGSDDENDTTKSIKNEHSFNEIQTSSIQQLIFENKNLFEYIFTDNNSIVNNLKPSYTLRPTDFRFFNKLIECIDNNNAISAIGTLEFLDQISKYHTTNTICFLDQDININTSDYLPIYDKDGVFNPEFNKP